MAARRAPREDGLAAPPGQVVVGKDVLELVSTAMYTDPLTIYREYVQNAADAIDLAVQAGLLGSRSDGRIDVRVDPVAREAWVRDNGSGIPAESAARLLSAVGASVKRGQGVRGFRGIGRLAALGACQSLTFRTQASGEGVVTEVRWDCRTLRTLLRDPEYTGELEDIVREVVTVRDTAAENPEEHFFEVHLQHVIRLRGDALLNEELIRRYLAQVAPVPFAPEFPYAAEVSAFLEEYLPGGHFEIRVGDGAPVVRPHRNGLQVTQNKRDSYVGLETITLTDPDLRGPVAVGWIAHHNYLGAISAERDVSGLRARVGGIQVGGPDLFAGIFAESRFSGWVVGEIHVLDPRVVPNARRDDFEQHPAVASLLNQLAPLGRALTLRTRDSSKARARVKSFSDAASRTEVVLSTLEARLVRGASAETLLREAAGGLRAMEKAVGPDLFPETEPGERGALLTDLTERYNALRSGTTTDTHPLEHRTQPERDLYDQIMAIIFQSVEDPKMARSVLEKVAQGVAPG